MYDKKLPPSIKNHELAWLLKPLWKRMHIKNKMCSFVAVAEPGSGKSWLALSLAQILDRDSDDVPRFDISRVCFSAAQFSQIISKEWPKGTAIIMDDAGLALYSREAMTKIVRQISKTFQSCRYKNLCIFLTLPALNMLDSNVRKLINSYLEPIEIDFKKQRVKTKFQHIQVVPKTGDVYFHRPEIRKRVLHPSGYSVIETTTVNNIWVERPPENLAVAYEKKKRLYLDEWNRRNAVDLSYIEKPTKTKGEFKLWYNEVKKNPQKFYVEGKQKVDPVKIVIQFGCGIFPASAIARSINKGLNVEEQAK